MSQPQPSPGVSFVDEELDPDDAVVRRAERRHATVESWWPHGGGAAITGLVFVLVAWIAAQPFVTAVTMLAPSGQHRIGPLDDQALSFGTGEYFGVTPGLLPWVGFGTRAVLAAIALAFAVRARRSGRSSLATAAVTSASVSLLLFVAGGVIATIGIAMGHAPSYGVGL